MKTRDKHSGQYAHTIEALCKCGHPLGLHTAAVAAAVRECLAGDFGHEHCECNKFRKVKVQG